MGIIKRRYDVVDHLGPPDPASDDYLDYLNGPDEPKTEFGKWYEEAKEATSTGYTRAAFAGPDDDVDDLQWFPLQSAVLRSDDDLMSNAPVIIKGPPLPAYTVNDIIDADEATLTVYTETEPEPFGGNSPYYIPRVNHREMILEVAGQKYRIRQYTVTHEDR